MAGLVVRSGYSFLLELMIFWLLLLALQYDPNLHPKFVEATRLLQQQKLVEAIALLEALTREKPQVGEYWFALGVAQAASGSLAGSLEPTVPKSV